MGQSSKITDTPRGRGRPRKDASAPGGSSSKVAKRAPGRPPKSSTTRGPGRPRKVVYTTGEAQPKPTTGRRGRPSKVRPLEAEEP